MSNKKKFKKFSRADLIKEIESGNKETNIVSNLESNKKAKIQYSSAGPIGANMDYVKSDLRRIAMVFSLVMIVLIGIIYVDKKTTVFNSFTDNLIKTLNIHQ